MFLQALLFCRHLRLFLTYGLLLDGIRAARCVDGRVKVCQDILSNGHRRILTSRHQIGFVFLQEGQLNILQRVVIRELFSEFIQMTPTVSSIFPLFGEHLIVGGKNRAVSGLAVVCLFEFGKGLISLAFLPKSFKRLGTEHTRATMLLVGVVLSSQSRLIVAGYQTIVAVSPEQQIIEIAHVRVIVTDIGETDDRQSVRVTRRLLANKAEVLLIGIFQCLCSRTLVQSETTLTVADVDNQVGIVAGRVTAHLL